MRETFVDSLKSTFGSFHCLRLAFPASVFAFVLKFEYMCRMTTYNVYRQTIVQRLTFP